MTLSSSAQFETAYQELLTQVQLETFPNVRSQLALCLSHLNRSNAEGLRHQCHQLFEALWSSTDYANPQLLCEIFSPYMGRSQSQIPDIELLNHPDVIRSILLMGNAFDVNSIFLSRDQNPLLQYFLLSLPKIDPNPPREGAFFEHMGSGLLGNQWDIIKSLYEFPLDDNWELRKTLRNIPGSALYLQKKSIINTTYLPQNMEDL